MDDYESPEVGPVDIMVKFRLTWRNRLNSLRLAFTRMKYGSMLLPDSMVQIRVGNSSKEADDA